MTAPPSWVQHVLTPHHADSSDVRWAIETAAAMWARGDQAQALRWLAHSVQTARGEGREERASELGRAVAELERFAGSAPPAKPQPVVALEQALPPSAVESASMKTTAPYKIAPDDITCLVAPDAKLLEQCETHSTPQSALDTDPETVPPVTPSPQPKSFERPRPPPSSMDLEPTMTAVGTTRSRKPSKTLVMHGLDPAISEAAADTAEAPQVRESKPLFGTESTRPYGFVPSSGVLEAPPSSDDHKLQSSLPTTLESPQSPLEPMRAVRVAIEGGVGSRFTIVLLADHETAPEGMQEALLVPLVAKDDAG